jgi:hypothetical protein
MILFRILWIVTVIVSLIVLYFFIEGLTDGSITERNMMLWMGLLAVCAVASLGAPWLRHHQNPVLGLVVTAVVAVPSLIFALVMLITILSGSKWN